MGDIRVLTSLGFHYFNEHPLSDYVSYNDDTVMRLLLTCLEKEDSCVYVAVDGDEVVGFLAGTIVPLFFNADIQVAVEFAWYVIPIYRDVSSYGLLLYGYFEQWARSRRADAITICAPTNSKSPYSHLGFTSIDSQHIKRLEYT